MSSEALAGPHEAFQLYYTIDACLLTDGLTIFVPRVVDYPDVPESTRLLLPDTLASCRASGRIALVASKSQYGSDLEFRPVSRGGRISRPYATNPAAYRAHTDPHYPEDSAVTWRDNQPVAKQTVADLIGYLSTL